MKPQPAPLFTEEAAERDAQCVAAVRGGDVQAFDKLVTAYQRTAVGTAYRLLNNSDDAQEVVQDAFIKAYRALDRLQDPRRFGAWLLRIVSNLSLNARRSRKSGMTVPLDEKQGLDGAGVDGPPMAVAPGPQRRLEGQELEAALDAALAELPEKQRLALTLFTMEGWAQKDIAEFLECSLETVKWSVFQARKKLKDKLGEHLS